MQRPTESVRCSNTLAHSVTQSLIQWWCPVTKCPVTGCHQGCNCHQDRKDKMTFLACNLLPLPKCDVLRQ